MQNERIRNEEHIEYDSDETPDSGNLTIMNYKVPPFVLQVNCYFSFSLPLSPLRERKKENGE